MSELKLDKNIQEKEYIKLIKYILLSINSLLLSLNSLFICLFIYLI
jgi:hypothetical protein